MSLSGGYAPFGQLAVAVLEMVAQIRGVVLAPSNGDEFKDLMARLPAHQDAVPALDMLKDAGFRLVTLTNTPAAAGQAVLQKAGLAHYFEAQFSVDGVQRFKPAPETYRSVESALGADAGALRMVAAHTWDTLGATAAGWQAALVTRPGNAALPLGPQPDIVENDLVAVARRVIGTNAG